MIIIAKEYVHFIFASAHLVCHRHHHNGCPDGDLKRKFPHACRHGMGTRHR